jgi:hypothetical protein
MFWNIQNSKYTNPSPNTSMYRFKDILIESQNYL